MMEFIENVFLTLLVSAAIIGVLVLGFFAGSSKNTDTRKTVVPGEVIFRSRTTVVRQGRKVRIVKEYIDNNDDMWEI